jgi:hypothetical protein
MSGTTAKGRRKTWAAFGGALALLVIVLLTLALLHKRSQPRLPPPPAPPEKIQLPVEAQPKSEAKPPASKPVDVLVWMESNPVGARIVRVSSGFVLGRTPEVIELEQSTEPVLVRFELEGYIPLTREVSAASDSTLTVELKAIPKKPARKR